MTDDFAGWSYDDLVSEIDCVGDMTESYAEMTSEQERGFRQAYAKAGLVVPEDMQLAFTMEDGHRQAAIIRQLLRRGIPVAKVAEDTFFTEEDLLWFAAQWPDADPSRN